MGIGKFGWKDQQPTVLSFVADAYLMEMGVTSRLRPNEVTRVCEVNNGIEDVPDNLGLANIDHFAQFIRGRRRRRGMTRWPRHRTRKRATTCSFRSGVLPATLKR